MGAMYFVSVDSVALVAATAKSIFELATPAGARAKIVEWWVEFDGTSPANTPVRIEAGRFSSGVTTATSATAAKYDPADGASVMTAKHSTTAEGAGTASDVFNHRVNPTTGLYIQYPLGRELILATSSFFRIRCLAANGVNVSFGVSWEE